MRDGKTKEIFIVDGYNINIELYKIELDIAFGQVKDVERFYGKDSDGFLNSTTDSLHFIWIRNRKDLKNLVHELYHLVNRISKIVGLSDDDNNEQQAYLISWLFNEIRKLK